MPALTRCRSAASIAVASMCLLGMMATPAFAGIGDSTDPDYPPAKKPEPSDAISSSVRYRESAPGASAKPMAPVSGNWSPPACWYEPQFTPKQFGDYLAKHDYGGGSAGTSERGEYLDETGGKLHKGDHGSWYMLKRSSAADIGEAMDRCGALHTYTWVGPADPAPPGTPVITPEILAGLAYGRTKLPTPPVTLKPAPDRLKVNLPTRVSFEGHLDQVSVTASISNPGLGINIAATTVATPRQLHLVAGTDYADPQSCTYDLVKKGGTYAVESGDSGCLITYRKSSGTGTYTLHASITWDVTWNPTADPGGKPVRNDLPDGETANDIPVTVKEIQAINR